MSTTSHPTQPIGPYDPIFGLQEKVASLLIPIFKSEDTDELFAYQIACRSLQAYEPETRADFVNAGRTIAFALAAIALLGEAADPSMYLKDKKRILIHANALNRSADQAERSMMDRRRYHRAYPTLPVHHPAATTPETQSPEPDDAEIHTQIAEAVTQIDQPQIDQPSPISPQINLEPAPKKISNIHYADPNCANAQPNKADPLIAPAMIHAAPQHSSAPRPM